MNRTFACALLAFSFAPCGAQDAQVTRLHCEGTYNNYGDAELRDISAKGILVEVSGDKVRIQGSIAFDTDYSVTTRLETGLGIVARSNQSYSGFLNRFSGQLSLSERGEAAKDGTYKVRQTLSATCKKAAPLF